ncbi:MULTISPECIES: hypothetical protein [unclassified Streptomyces]|uniref:hypothetical protein n=1 Tax=unclassified Streptomyces TaxID=2593676 RepID=UPI000BF0435D|nr:MULTISPECIES: hypothetical protein [unclassified Streptomyces]MBD3556362.1 hypothetical protein [Streptomyces sp. SP18CM02]
MNEPTHHTTYNGPVFHQTGAQNIGINHGCAKMSQDPELRAAVAELTARLNEISGHLSAEQVRTVEETLPVLALDREAMAERGLTLARISQIANALGSVAQPVADAVGRVLGLLG